MAALASAHPDLVSTFSLPHPSLDGKQINGIEIGQDVAAPRPGCRCSSCSASTTRASGRPGSTRWSSRSTWSTNYGTDPRITDLVNRSRVIVVPVLNVDGFDKSRTDGELIDLRAADNGGTATILGTPGNAYMRKNCRLVDGQDTPDGTLRASRRPAPAATASAST